MNTEPNSYRIYLRELLIKKKRQNPRFSLRSFAKLLGIQPTFLSYILNGKRDLSDAMIGQFVEKLKLTEEEGRIFELLVKFEKAKHVPSRNKIREALIEADPTRSSQRDLSIDHFTLISDWHHYAIFILIDLEDFVWSIPNVSRALRINSFEVQHALDRLKALELIDFKEYERPKKLETRILVNSVVPSEAVRNYHLEILKKTAEAIESLPVSERFNGSEMLALSAEQLPEAREIIETCYKKLFTLSRKKSKNQTVYQMGMHLIPITVTETKNRPPTN